MRVFLDTSVILAACGSATGTANRIFDLAPGRGWTLIATPYVLREVANNLGRFPAGARETWNRLLPQLNVMDDIVTINRPTSFSVSKDRPVLFSALAWSQVLLTLDSSDFGPLLNGNFYGLAIIRPGDFLRREGVRGDS